MLTLFAVPRPFHGHYGVIQRNAIKSWTLLRPTPEIILLGTDKGTAEIAREFGVRHVPELEYNEKGRPRGDSMYKEAERVSQEPLVCIVNADIILMNNFMWAVEQVARRDHPFLMVGQRSNLDVDQPLDFESDWESDLRQRMIETGHMGPRTGEDYILSPRGFFGEIPPFVMGHSYMDGWLLYTARRKGADLIDATQAVTAIHQNHGYSHIEMGPQGHVIDPQTKINEELAGGSAHMLIMRDRTHILTPNGLKPARDWWRLWRLLRTSLVLYPRLPFPVRVFLKITNATINVGRRLLERVSVLRPNRGPRYG